MDCLELVEQLIADLNEAHSEILRQQGAMEPEEFDWPEWSSPANSIREGERLLGKRLAKTNYWTLYPTITGEEQ